MDEGKSMKKKILITDRFAQDSFLFLQRQPNLEIVRSEHPFHLPLEALISCHGLLIRSRTEISEELLKKARNLQVIITATSGFDHIDLAATQKWGVTVMHTPSANIESAAQLTWTLVLASCSKLLQAHKMVKSTDWDRNQLIGLELSSHRYGIIGLGRIGRRVAQMARCFDMSVSAYDPYVDDDIFEEHQVQRASYEEVLKTSDIVSFHVPKTPETEHMLGRSQFEFMNRGIILINTSRGSVISENDLCEALEKGWIRAMGMDVFEKEPLPKSSRLLGFHNVIMTPHIGANTEDAFYKASQIAAEKLVQFFLDGSTSDSLPPRVPWFGVLPNS